MAKCGSVEACLNFPFFQNSLNSTQALSWLTPCFPGTGSITNSSQQSSKSHNKVHHHNTKVHIQPVLELFCPSLLSTRQPFPTLPSWSSAFFNSLFPDQKNQQATPLWALLALPWLLWVSCGSLLLSTASATASSPYFLSSSVSL